MEQNWNNIDLVQASKAFAIDIVKLHRRLKELHEEQYLIEQLLQNGTRIGFSMSEATATYSHADYFTKIYTALEAARKTMYWLDLIYNGGYISTEEYGYFYDQCELLIKELKSAMKQYDFHNAFV